jgi:hypothetical protein
LGITIEGNIWLGSTQLQNIGKGTACFWQTEGSGMYGIFVGKMAVVHAKSVPGREFNFDPHPSQRRNQKIRQLRS